METLKLYEEVALVGTHPEKGKRLIQRVWQGSLAGAILLDGLLDDCIEPTKTGIETRSRAVDGEGGFVGAMLYEVEIRIKAQAGRRGELTLRNWLNTLSNLKDFEMRVMKQMEERGLIQINKDRSGGLFVRTVYPHTSLRLRQDIVSGLVYVLSNGQKPTAHQALLIKLLSPSLFYMQLLAGLSGPDRAAAARHFFAIAQAPMSQFGIEALLPPDLTPRVYFRTSGQGTAAQVISNVVEDLRMSLATGLVYDFD